MPLTVAGQWRIYTAFSLRIVCGDDCPLLYVSMRPIDVPVEKVATGFAFTEGPVWLPDNSLIFSDIPNNNIRRWTPDGAVTIWRARSGCDDPDESSPNRGSNGMTLDREGCVLICEHGNRRVTRLERDGGLTPLAV